ncbi:CYTH domain-containing protein [Clostridium sp. SM-530-WT-3G]|uniref:CYTH domain-containing protein n=1 Tax=Clostridium sp. SM-530-WT-3G TaxID=2725303 RepID=UPI00145C71EC|nr:CYTH domain-containing protein [Clostridium sp. SM-530-WT-3G]NME83321.1 CYTH domain-containing protein [Clostridium sp. SM-530-WT-3G]
MEIERKWLFNIDDVPTELSKTITDYKQGYISIEPEVRIRKRIVKNLVTMENSKETYALCIKGNGTLTRHEIQKDITEQEYKELQEVGNITEDMMISKHYYAIPIVCDNNKIYRLTVGVVDADTPNEFCYGEIEFDTEEEAKAFNPPDWFGEDVTEDYSYKMKNYWKRTRL